MIGGHLISWYTPYTQNIQTTFFLCLAVVPPQEKKVCRIIQSVIDPQHTVSPTINILSAHAHSEGTEPRRRSGISGESRITPIPCTTGGNAASDMTWSALERPFREALEATG